MTHGAVLVITPNKEDMNKEIEKAMFPYWELNLSINDELKDSRVIWTEETYLSLEKLKKYYTEMEEKDKEYFREWGSRQVKEGFGFTGSFEDYIKYEGYKLENGKIYYGSNPNAKWDWYQIGGRWNGGLKVKEKKGIKGTPGLMTSEKEDYDSALKKDIENLKLITSRAVITIDGKWVEHSKLGWFGTHGDCQFSFIPKKVNPKDVISMLIRSHYRWQYLADILRILEECYHKNYEGCIEDNCIHESKFGDNGFYEVKKELTDEQKKLIQNNDTFNWWGWNESFYDTFIKDLPEDCRLTIVDYHI